MLQLLGAHLRGEGPRLRPYPGDAVEVRQRKPGTKLKPQRSGCYAGLVRLAVVPGRSARALGGFVKTVVAPGARLITDD